MNLLAVCVHLVHESSGVGMSKQHDRLVDEYLVASIQTGSRAALDQLAKRWHVRLLAHAIRLCGEREMARDVVQSAWAEIVKGIDRLEDGRAFPAWAFRIVSRRCAREIRDLVKRRSLAREVERQPLEEVRPLEPSDAVRLQEAIRYLSPAERAAVALYHFEELSVAEVAVALAVPVGTVKTRLMHARRKLRAIFEGEKS